ncbi:MAG: hypothetical protein AAF604_10480 [Acidobacteriota bacterium]
MTRTSKLLWVALLALLMLAVVGPTTVAAEESTAAFAQDSKKGNADDPDGTRRIEEAIRLFNGNWILYKRYNPDGSEHRQPLQGTTVIDLKPVYSTFGILGTRALGTIAAQESGVLDERCDNCGPAEARGRPFKIESNGTWAVTLGEDENKSFVVKVAATSRIKGNYAPYLDGLNVKVDTSYRIAKPGNTLRDGAMLNMLKPVMFANQSSPPTTDDGEFIPQHETADSC